MAQVTELVTKFSFSGSLSPLMTFNKNLGGAIKLSAAFGAALVAGSAAFMKWSSSALQALDPLAQLSNRTGVAIGRIQELGFVASQSGSDVATMQSSILSLSQTIGDAAIRGNEDFSRLGISVRDAAGQVKNADQVIGEIGDRFKALNLSMQEQESIAGSLGIDSSLVQMLNRSSEEMASLSAEARELGTLTEAQSEQVIKYNDALNKQRFAVNAVKQSIAIGFAPTLTKLTDNFTALVSENKEWITNVAARTIDIAVEIADAIKNTSVAVFEFIDSVTAGNGALSILIATATAFAVSNPLLAAISATILIIDDLVTAFEGGNSVIANFFEDMFGIDIVRQITDFNKLIGDTVDAVKFLTGSGDYTPATIPQHLQDEFDYIPGENGDMVMVPRNTNVTQDNTINIYTNDAREAGRAVGENLQIQLENANAQTSAGGM